MVIVVQVFDGERAVCSRPSIMMDSFEIENVTCEFRRR